MQIHIEKWGTSCAIRLPRMVGEALGFCLGDVITLTLKDDGLVLHKNRPKYSLAELVNQMNPKNVPESFEGSSVGEEIL